eukprot:gene25565-34126_t
MNRPVDDSSSSDTKLLLQEAEQLFKREDDIKDIADIRKMQQEVQLQCNSQLRDAKEIIKVMTSLVGKKEAEIVPPSYADHAAALKKVSNKENLNSQMDSLLHAIDEKKQRIDALHNSHASLMQQLQDARSGQHQSAAVDSRTVYALSLFPLFHMSDVSDENRKEVVPFQLNTMESTPFEISNTLWTLIGQSLQ